MSYRHTWTKFLAVVSYIGLILTSWTSTSYAGSPAKLTARSFKIHYDLYEPVVFLINYDAIDTAPEKNGIVPNTPRIRKLIAELLVDGEPVARAFLNGTGFSAVSGQPKSFVTTVWGCFGEKTIGLTESGFTFWDTPGKYQVVVRDPDGDLVAEALPVEIMKPADPRAAALFASGGVHSLWMVHSPFLDKQEGDRETARKFEQLASDFPGSVYGRFAKIILSLQEENLTRRRYSDNMEKTFLSERLSICCEGFEPGHPFRLFALTRVAQLQRGLGFLQQAGRAACLIRSEAADSFFLEEVRDIKAE